MKNFFKWFLISLGLLLAVFVVGGSFIPKEWEVTRSKTMSGSKDVVFEQIANLKNWQNWSVWTQEKDPTQVYSYEGPELGAGAKWLWTSENMGTGWLLIKEADVNQGITYELFIDMGSMQSTMHSSMAFELSDSKFNLVWTDRGDSGNNLIKRWMSLLVQNMLGAEMEEGLNKLEEITKASAEASAEDI